MFFNKTAIERCAYFDKMLLKENPVLNTTVEATSVVPQGFQATRKKHE